MEHASAEGIGTRLRELRRARGLNQNDLASDDLSVSYVSLIETGKRIPSESVLATLAGRLGTSVSFLRTGQEGDVRRELELGAAFGDMALRTGATGEALQRYTQVLAAGPVAGPELTRRARLGQALALTRLGQLDKAVKLLDELYNDPATVAGSLLWTQAAAALCHCHSECGDHVLSVEIGERAVRRLDQMGLDATDDHVQLGVALLNAYLLWGDLDRAEPLARRVRDWIGPVESPVNRSSVYWNAALVAHSRGSDAEALVLAERALGLAAATDGVRYRARLRDVYGALLLESGASDAQEALELFDSAQTTLLEVGTIVEQARCETHIAIAQLRLGRAEEARGHAGRALGLLRNEDRADTVEARTVLAHALFQLGDHEEAEHTLHAAVRQLRQVPRSRTSSGVWRRIGDLWHQHGYALEALTAYQQALSDAGVPGLPLREPVPVSTEGTLGP